MASPGVFTGSDAELLALGRLLLSLTVPHTHTHVCYRESEIKAQCSPTEGAKGGNVCFAELNNSADFSAIRQKEKRKEKQIGEVLKVTASEFFGQCETTTIYAVWIDSTFRCETAEICSHEDQEQRPSTTCFLV